MTRWLWLLLALCAVPAAGRTVVGGWFLGQEVIPAIMYERVPGRSMYVATLKTGFPPKERRLLLVQGAVPGPWASFSFDPAGESNSVVQTPQGAKERVHVAGRSLWISYEVNPAAAAGLGCASCQGVLYLGAASPLWSTAQRLSFGAGNVVLNEYSHRWSVETAQGNGFACEVGRPDSLCVTQGEYDGTPVAVEWNLLAGETRLPEAIYYRFLRDRHPRITPLDDFEDFVVKLTGPGAGPNAELRIPRRHVIAQHLTHDHTLTVVPWKGDSIVVGQDALRSTRLYVDLSAGRAWAAPFYSNRGYSVQAAILLFVFGVVLMRVLWGAPVPVVGRAFHEGYGRYVVLHVLLDVVSVLAPVAALANPAIWGVLANDWWPGAVLVGCAAFYVGYGAVGLAGLWASAPEREGWYWLPGPDLPTVHRVNPGPWVRPHNRDTFDGQLLRLQPGPVLGTIRQSVLLRGSMLGGLALACFLLAAETRPDYFSGLTLACIGYLWFYLHTAHLLIALHFSRHSASPGWLIFLAADAAAWAALAATLFFYTLVPVMQTVYTERGVSFLLVLFNATMACVLGVALLLRSPLEPFLRMQRAQEM